MDELTANINKLFPALELILSNEVLTVLNNYGNDELYIFHFGFGTWIRNNFLNERSLLYALFMENNITCKNDMSFYIIKMFHEYIKDAQRD